MKPMTKEEWDARQSVIRRVVDPETGRTRCAPGGVKGCREGRLGQRPTRVNRSRQHVDGAPSASPRQLLPASRSLAVQPLHTVLPIPCIVLYVFGRSPKQLSGTEVGAVQLCGKGANLLTSKSDFGPTAERVPLVQRCPC